MHPLLIAFIDAILLVTINDFLDATLDIDIAAIITMIIAIIMLCVGWSVATASKVHCIIEVLGNVGLELGSDGVHIPSKVSLPAARPKHISHTLDVNPILAHARWGLSQSLALLHLMDKCIPDVGQCLDCELDKKRFRRLA